MLTDDVDKRIDNRTNNQALKPDPKTVKKIAALASKVAFDGKISSEEVGRGGKLEFLKDIARYSVTIVGLIEESVLCSNASSHQVALGGR